MVKKLLILICIPFAVVTSCKKDECKACYTGTLQEISRAFCGKYWQINLDRPDKDGGYQIRALNITDFQVTLQNGQKVELSFEDDSIPQPCLDAKYINLKTIRDL